jgi:hypothetical protein
MSSKTADIDIATVRRIVREDAAGTAHATIARGLVDDGVAVPRWDQNPVNGTPGSRTDGYCLPTDLANPDKWTAAAVAAVLASPQAVTTNGFAAARAVLGSDRTTRLTIA